MPFGLPPAAFDRLVTLLGRDDRIRKIWLYGSRALGKEKPGSDIDICLDAPTFGLEELALLETQLDELLLPWKVDLVLLHQISDPDLLDHIRRVGIEVVGERASASREQKS